MCTQTVNLWCVCWYYIYRLLDISTVVRMHMWLHFKQWLELHPMVPTTKNLLHKYFQLVDIKRQTTYDAAYFNKSYTCNVYIVMSVTWWLYLEILKCCFHHYESMPFFCCDCISKKKSFLLLSLGKRALKSFLLLSLRKRANALGLPMQQDMVLLSWKNIHRYHQLHKVHVLCLT